MVIPIPNISLHQVRVICIILQRTCHVKGCDCPPRWCQADGIIWMIKEKENFPVAYKSRLVT